MRRISLGALLACLMWPGTAWADSGSITNVTAVGSQISATYTSTSTCAGEPERPSDCGWWPHAVQGPASSPCYEYQQGDGRLTYVGGNGNSIWIGPNIETTTESFYPDSNPVRICLYINYGSSRPRVLVAQYVYPPTTTAPAPTPTPTPPSTDPPDEGTATYIPMGISEARRLVPDTLQSKYKSRFSRATLTRGCSRLSTRKVRCRVAWHKRPYKYSGTVTLWYGDDDVADDYNTYTYQLSVKRTRIKTRSGGGGGGGSKPPAAKPSCNPNYSGVCLPLTGDVDCGDITARDFRSIGSDPFRLDGDNDGIACES